MNATKQAQEILRVVPEGSTSGQVAQAYLEREAELAALRRRFQDEVAINATNISNLCRDLQIPIHIGGPWWDLVKQRVAYLESELERERELRVKLEAALREATQLLYASRKTAWPWIKPNAITWEEWEGTMKLIDEQIERNGALCDEAKLKLREPFCRLRKVLKAQQAANKDPLPHWYELRINQGEPTPATVLSLWRNKKGPDGLLCSECYAASGPAFDEADAISRVLKQLALCDEAKRTEYVGESQSSDDSPFDN